MVPRRAGEDAPRLAWCGDACLVAEFGDVIDPRVNSRVQALGVRLATLAPPWLVETVPSNPTSHTTTTNTASASRRENQRGSR